MPDLTPWEGIIPLVNDLVFFGGLGLYYLGKYKGRKSRSTSLVKV
jgi:hypothetical protein